MGLRSGPHRGRRFGDETFGNLTLTVNPHGEVSLRLPKPLEHLANAKHGRYVLSGTAAFSYRADEWCARITGGKSVSYTLSRKPGRAGRYLTAAWAVTSENLDVGVETPDTEVRAGGPVVGVDLNDGHLALRQLDEHGNPVGQPERIDFDLKGSRARRDAEVRHAITRLIHYTIGHGIDTVAVEDLDFADALAVGGRRWVEDRAPSASVERWPVSRPRRSATALRPRLTDRAFAYLRSIPPTPARGETSIGARRMRTSPDTRRPPL